MFLPTNHVGKNRRFRRPQKGQKTVQKGPEAPKPICLAKNKREGVDLRRTNAGVEKLSSFVCTFMVTKEHGKSTKGGVGKLHRTTPLRKYVLDKHIRERSEIVG